ncbi:MAG: ATP synthase F1 subunit delta [Desulfuromonas sp.]|uniref:ATP synthase F1 subunit delta n=1 Tax=Desulfuromonas sp. TaxID=892 RepID=UPI000CB82854|nr:ATP synthase F1 subunit delta [Desulfuromonas sp.]PLX83300.1 MAG: ATP synthase F1 subunit delta [Desulfuromonas sp.]
MSTSAISRRYAKALVELGSEQKMMETYGEELVQVSSVLAAEDMLRLILESPSFHREKKAAILGDIMGALKLSDGMVKFLGLLLEKDRLKYLSQIEGNFRGLADELSGTLRANITSAAQLAEGQVSAIGSGLEKQTGKTVKLTVEIDPSLIGGLQAQIGGRVFDGTIRTQLKRIEDTLQKG